MANNDQSYRQILKATSLFGGVQVFSIIISVIRSKAIAVWLGPSGVGIIGLLTNSLKVIGEFTKLGIDVTAVREISIANEHEDTDRIPTIVTSLKRIVWVTGLFGMLVTIILSPLLSKIAFGNFEYTIAFIWISVSLLFNQLSSGQLAILQGLRKLKYLAKANVYGNFLGLLIALPLYYFFRVDAIVPTIIVTSVCGLLFSWFFSNKIKIEKKNITNSQAFKEGKQMLNLGFMLSLRGLITLVTLYALQVFISHFGGVDEVGFYTAGFVIINSYVGLIFNAMRTDYFPRLSATINNHEKMGIAVFQQATVAVLILTPIIIVFLTLAPFIIKVLYSKEFLVIEGMITWGMMATLFQAISWSMGYIILAKGNSKLFIKTSIFFNMLLLGFGIIGYYFGGLKGIGISYLLYYIVHTIAINIILNYKYQFKMLKDFFKPFSICFVFCALAFSALLFTVGILKFFLLGGIILISSIFTFNELNKRTNFIMFIKKKFSSEDD
ncbi:oligosaccharide flippase family protein [Meridianimaribacter flavus]|uniref:PST family polysaccharide transporter n=1 Tax=Meridianimaribacter flavus TaxID=571115 RepID=A0ABY2G8V6_9FLAO|nr:oligosaccharide flippase family protein [Meridianimaribacter flavus]TDY14224.1 PST family polysaccharide transporter [Meridianimaribacter flavus]